MKKTQWLGNLDIMKSGVVLLFIIVLVVSLVYLPMIYNDVHSQIQTTLDGLMTNLRASGEIPDALVVLRETQEHLESHNLIWLYGNIITGYGNIITLIVIGGSLLLRNVFTKHFPVNKITELMLPSFFMSAIEGSISTFGFQSGTAEVETTPSGDE